MAHTSISGILLSLALLLSVNAQDKPVPVQFRAVLHDPVNPAPSLYYANQTGAFVRLDFRPRDLTEPLSTRPVDGSLVFHNTAQVDPENPAASIVAIANLPGALKSAIIIVVPAPEESKMDYRIMVINDSETSFPKGESRVLPFIGVETAVQAGEHKISIEPGKICRIPAVRKVDEFNMAQANFHYRDGSSWLPFAERRLHFTDASRRIFIIHATPGALAPTVSTIVDTSPAGTAR